MNIPIPKSMLKRIKVIKKLIKKDKGLGKSFKQKCATTKGLIVEMLVEGTNRWEFIHDDQGREVRRKKFLEDKEKTNKKKKKKK